MVSRNYSNLIIICHMVSGGVHGVMVTVIGNGHGDLSSNPRWGSLHFHIALISLGKV